MSTGVDGDTFLVTAHQDNNEIHGIYGRCIKEKVHPFFVRHSRWVLLAWLVIGALIIWQGPKFFGMTESDFSVPDGTNSKLAIDSYNKNYPNASDSTKLTIILRLQDSQPAGASIINNASREAFESLNATLSAKNVNHLVTSASGYSGT